jgi:hypothetical protein
MSIKNSNDTIENRTRDLPACSAVPQPTAPPCAPTNFHVMHYCFLNLVVYVPLGIFIPWQAEICRLAVRTNQSWGGVCSIWQWLYYWAFICDCGLLLVILYSMCIYQPSGKSSLLRSCRWQGLIHTFTQINTLFKTFCINYHYCVLIYDTIHFGRYVAPKPWYLSTKLHHVTSQKTAVCEVTAQITLNLLFIWNVLLCFGFSKNSKTYSVRTNVALRSICLTIVSAQKQR